MDFFDDLNPAFRDEEAFIDTDGLYDDDGVFVFGHNEVNEEYLNDPLDDIEDAPEPDTYIAFHGDTFVVYDYETDKILDKFETIEGAFDQYPDSVYV